MSAEFWWGLAALPLGALALAIVVGLPAWTLYAVERYRKEHRFVMSESGEEGPVGLAAILAISKWARQVHLPLGYRVTVSRDRRGSTPRNDGANGRFHAIQDALREEHSKGA